MRENIKIRTLGQVLHGELPTNTIVGNRLVGNEFQVAFVATDSVTKKPLWNKADDKVRLNWKKSLRQDIQNQFKE